MSSKISKELSNHRLEQAKEDLISAKLNYEHNLYKSANNRAYYSIFHAIRAVVALDGFDSSKHSGLIAHFNQNYVKTGIFSKELSKIIRAASENREKADYLDFFIASKDEAEKQIKRAELFSDSIREFLKGKSII